MTKPWVHRYVSTACEHATHEDRPELHAECRNTCKYTLEGRPVEPCHCSCHPQDGTRVLPPPWVDQARDGFVRLLAVIAEHGIDLADAEPDLHEAIKYGRAWFWARGEVQPPGVWTPPAQEG